MPALICSPVASVTPRTPLSSTSICDDVRVAADLGARAGRRRREGAGQRAGSARDERRRAGRMPFVRDLQEPRGRGPRRPWTRRGAEDPATADDRARDRRLEPLGGEIGDRHRPPAQQLVQPRSSEPADRPTGGHQIPQLAWTRLVERRRHLPEESADCARNRDRRFGELRPSRGIGRRPAARATARSATRRATARAPCRRRPERTR